MAYKKEKKGATLVVNQMGNSEINVTGNYFNKYVHHQVKIKQNKTTINVGTHRYEYHDKPVVWRDKWLKSRFINCKQQIGNQLWYINYSSLGYNITFTEEVNRIDIGDDFRNIKKCQWLGKIVSRLNQYFKQEKDNSIVLSPDAEGYNDKMYAVKPEILISCIESVNKDFPYLLLTEQEAYEHAQNIFEVTQGREPELDDLPF
tara:strand:- start:2225 stop:2833 length:609 start_codon:yes stop_codon:yes gene_type:complete